MAKRKNRLFPNGRNATSTSFIMLENYVFDSPAFRSLRPGPRALLLELIRRHNGNNNGTIGLGVREAAVAICVGKNAAESYFRTLVEAGFIARERFAGFNMKDVTGRRATEWRLTWIRTERTPATKEFLKAREKSTVPMKGTMRPHERDKAPSPPPDCPHERDVNANIEPLERPRERDTYISSHRPRASGGCGWWSSDFVASAQIAILESLIGPSRVKLAA